MTFEGAAHGDDRRGRGADDRARRGGADGGDQAARHQRRRLLRAELDASRTRTRRRSRTSSRRGRSSSSRWRMVWTLGVHGRPPALRRRRLRDDAGALPADGDVRRRAGGRAAIRRSPAMGVDQSTGSMEGKEVRFGAGLSALGRVTTTVTSNGSVNAMHDSLTPLGGLMPMVGMWLNNIFGGVGVGFINMLIFIIVAVFVAGHDDRPHARVPGQEGRGQGDEAGEPRAAVASAARSWSGTAIACYVWAHDRAIPDTALGWLQEPGPARLLRDALRVPLGRRQQRVGLRGARRQHAVLEHLDRPGDAALALHPDHRAAGAGRRRLAAKPAAPETAGSLRADSATFGFTLWAVVVILGLLMFMPVAVLGPIAEHLALR